jgi:hypothetical protein
MKVYYTHRIPPTCFGHLRDHLQGGALQRIHPNITEIFEPMHRYKILNFKDYVWLKYILKIKIQIKVFVIDCNG